MSETKAQQTTENHLSALREDAKSFPRAELAGRHTSRQCASCVHWRRAPRRMVTAGSGVPKPIGDDSGECRAGPPKASYSWPRTYDTDECGAWKPRPKTQTEAAA